MSEERRRDRKVRKEKRKEADEQEGGSGRGPGGGLKREMKMENERQKLRRPYICNISSVANTTSLLSRLITPYNSICHADMCL